MGVKTFTHSSPGHSQELLQKLNALRREGQLCDVTIRVQDQVFLAHRVVLVCCSDFFRAQLLGRPEQQDQVVLDLHHVTVSGFRPLLDYAYTATLSINTENIIDVLAAASYMQMFAVASTCSEFMKSSILWSAGGVAQDRRAEPGPDSGAACTLTLQEGSLSPVSSECSVVERALPVCHEPSRESRRKRKAFLATSPESPLKCSAPAPNPSPSFPEAPAQPGDSSLAFPWTFPFGVDRRYHSDKAKAPDLPAPGPSDGSLATEEDVQVKVERLSDEEVQEEASQTVSGCQSSLSDQQTVPGSDPPQEELLISPQSSSIGSVDEGVAEGLPSMQGTSNPGGQAEEDERLESVQYPYHLYISPLARLGTNGPDKPFQCPTCGVRFTRIQNLKQHMLIHSGIKPFQCDRCGKKFTRAYSLKMHRLKHEVTSSCPTT
ncbi:zinc finger and BTB domain-containing protein 44-like isoform X2 [Megalops cyprinoides]|uniref:zinc finger and BTB domain-containing protein 44-like isoform X2 n=1 Tax=Megalops cyprinoides TaxID=118141 RepID=UPI001863DBFD|nr:zinc finger and BTB domain-containing protein 44-like isoform X2 [Megalops cyprinoides]